MLGFLGKQFIDVIEWNEQTDGTLAYRVPMTDNEIQSGAQLTVRESQIAVFVNEGWIADTFGPGLYRLNTQTLPILTNLKHWDKAFVSPFKSDVYFFTTRDQLDQRWGTAMPIVLRDAELGPMHLRAHGTFAYRLEDVRVFFTRVSGTRSSYTTEDLSGQLRSIVLTTLATVLGAGEVLFMEMAAQQRAFSDVLKAALRSEFSAYGLELTAFNVESLSLPTDVQTHLDRGTSIRAIGDLDDYVKLQAADGLTQAGSAAGEVARTGAGLGAGVAVGQALARAFAPSATEALPDALATIARLHELFKQGALTQVEFDAQKSALLATNK